MRILLTLATLAAGLCSHAFAATLTATPADWLAKWTAAACGDVLELEAETYPAARPLARSCPTAKPLVLDARAATFSGLVYAKGPVHGLTVRGGAWAGLKFDFARDVVVQDAKFVNPDDADNYGIFLKGGGGFRITGSTFEGYRTGIVLSAVDGAEVVGNGFSRMRSDGVQIGESRKVRVEANAFDGTRISGNEHPDCIQAWRSADLTIKGNTCIGMSQGIGLFNGPFQRVVIEGNDLFVGYPQAIKISGGEDSAVRNNRVRTYPRAQWRASINISGPSVERCGNRVDAGAGKRAIIDAPCSP